MTVNRPLSLLLSVKPEVSFFSLAKVVGNFNTSRGEKNARTLTMNMIFLAHLN